MTTKAKPKTENEVAPSTWEMDRSGKKGKEGFVEVETAQSLGEAHRIDELIKNATTGNMVSSSCNPGVKHISVCPVMSRSVVFQQQHKKEEEPELIHAGGWQPVDIADTTAGPEIHFAEVPCLLDDCAARYCRSLKAPIPVARKSCKKGTASCAECEAAYCRMIEGRN